MTLAAYAGTGLTVAGIHAVAILRGNTSAFHRRALAIALALGAPAAILQPLSGDVSARNVAATSPPSSPRSRRISRLGAVRRSTSAAGRMSTSA